MIPGEIRTAPGIIRVNSDAPRSEILVTNDGDRPIQVGSHAHFPDVNAFLSFDRERARGFRLDIASGTSIRFEPGVSRRVPLVALGGPGRDGVAAEGGDAETEGGGSWPS
ncbi:urease subunit beta [Streptomyces sp. TP-A0874]|uniref:urease subunit beta n=1 Tax=Streptomyces sp. TP-A0874 TaxID=549819 RepID=UPI0008539C34|nr:urease subunit beta [Streptomyces sp. TP-A0874]